jgi:hypothetical protein
MERKTEFPAHKRTEVENFLSSLSPSDRQILDALEIFHLDAWNLMIDGSNEDDAASIIRSSKFTVVTVDFTTICGNDLLMDGVVLVHSLMRLFHQSLRVVVVKVSAKTPTLSLDGIEAYNPQNWVFFIFSFVLLLNVSESNSQSPCEPLSQCIAVQATAIRVNSNYNSTQYRSWFLEQCTTWFPIGHSGKLLSIH